jgi:tetratricopeptide (TPR) repeat protein
MSIVRFAKNQMRGAQCIGRENFDGAIRFLEESLSNSSTDTPSLEMIAMCHRWSHRNDMAIASAQRALAYGPKHFGALRLLSEIYAEWKEHDIAAKFIRLGLESYPEPLPTTPKIFFWVFRLGATTFPRLRRIEEAAKRDIDDPNSGNDEWYSWAKQYLVWYDAAYGNHQTPTVH